MCTKLLLPGLLAPSPLVLTRTGTGVPGLGRGFSAMTQGLGGDGLASLHTPGTPVKVQPHDYNGYLAIVGRGAAACVHDRVRVADSSEDHIL